MPLDGAEISAQIASGSSPFSSASLPASSIALLSKLQNLPGAQRRDDILASLDQSPMLILSGAGASGKSTLAADTALRWIASQGGGGMVVQTAPNATAVRLAADYMCKLNNFNVDPQDQQVGYASSSNRAVADSNRIRYVTDEVMYEFAVRSPDLTKAGYKCVILDDLHLRSTASDLVISHLQNSLRENTSLRLIVIVEESDHSDYLRAFSFCKPRVVVLNPAIHAADVQFSATPTPDYLESTKLAVIACIKDTRVTGSVIAFLPKEDDCNVASDKLKEWLVSHTAPVDVFTLHALQSFDKHLRVFAPPVSGRLKVVFATDFATSSFDLPECQVSIDSGLVMQQAYDPASDSTRRLPTAISKVAAAYRQRRAGRDRAGLCIRLYTEAAYNALQDTDIPCIFRDDALASWLMQIALSSRTGKALTLRCSIPAIQRLRAAERCLKMGAVVAPPETSSDRFFKITGRGAEMIRWGLYPMLSRGLVAAMQDECGGTFADLAAVISIDQDFFLHLGDAVSQFADPYGDAFMRLNIFYSWLSAGQKKDWASANGVSQSACVAALQLRANLRNILPVDTMQHINLAEPDAHARLVKALLHGYISKLAERVPGGEDYRSVSEEDPAVRLVLSAKSCLNRMTTSRYLLVLQSETAELGVTKCSVTVLQAVVVESEWLVDVWGPTRTDKPEDKPPKRPATSATVPVGNVSTQQAPPRAPPTSTEVQSFEPDSDPTALASTPIEAPHASSSAPLPALSPGQTETAAAAPTTAQSPPPRVG